MAKLFPFESEKYVLLAKVTKAHGIKGELKIRSYSGSPDAIAGHSQLRLVSSSGILSPVFTVERARIGSKEAIVLLQGIHSRNQAETLCGMGVLVAKTDLPDLADKEFYLHELEGLNVTTVAGEAVGVVESFFNNGVQDLLVVRCGTEEILVPLIPRMIHSRDDGELVIAPPPGLLTINSGNKTSGKTPR
jgi:16S rRNA processing protein RimM